MEGNNIKIYIQKLKECGKYNAVFGRSLRPITLKPAYPVSWYYTLVTTLQKQKLAKDKVRRNGNLACITHKHCKPVNKKILVRY